MDRVFIKKALHAANTACIAFILSMTIASDLPDIPFGRLLGAIFVLCLDMGAIILALCPKKHISLGIIALGFVLCYCVFMPPVRYMEYITVPVWTLIFWGHFGDKKWWLFPIPLLIGIVFALFELYGWDIVGLKWMLVWGSLPFFSVLCTYSSRNTPWYEVCSVSIFVLFWAFFLVLLHKYAH